MDNNICNIAAALPRLAREFPDQPAIHYPGKPGENGFARYDVVMDYRTLDTRSDAIAAGLAKYGIAQGTRVVVMVRPSPEFFLLMFALFKAGAVPVLVDPGIDRSALKQCLDEAEPEAFIGIPLAHLGRIALGWAKSAKVLVTVGRRFLWGGVTLAQVESAGAGAGTQLIDTPADDIAAILFTSGSTGVPKGVVYRHRHLVAQVEMLGRAMKVQPEDVDFPTFPPFALYDPAMGMTSVIPDMDPTRPARADPRKLLDAVERFGVVQLFGSPALIRVLVEHGAPLPTLRRVTSAGAPVPPEIVAGMRKLLSEDAQFWTPYGATECLPVSIVESRELERTRTATETGAGTCVGLPVPPNEVRIIRITDDPIAVWSDEWLVPTGVIGEITVAGPTATDTYFNRDIATKLAKTAERLTDGNERIVHRMGDVGYFDDEGRLWFCGRKTQRVETTIGPFYTEQAEPIFNTHPQLRRTALVGVGEFGKQTPVLCYELLPGVDVQKASDIENELRELGSRYQHTREIRIFLRHPEFPVDIRHNTKIGREKLAIWAASQLPRR
ncbi:MAG: AMP-binding protein [Xanthomonadaceae bacterium]|jgi:acyl-CoA synthetase (AMP-forming)/AMP-acid ligase II|nr:AMP-binding protein [Xanthomonadaceae bacterium]